MVFIFFMWKMLVVIVVREYGVKNRYIGMRKERWKEIFFIVVVGVYV